MERIYSVGGPPIRLLLGFSWGLREGGGGAVRGWGSSGDEFLKMLSWVLGVIRITESLASSEKTRVVMCARVGGVSSHLKLSKKGCKRDGLPSLAA